MISLPPDTLPPGMQLPEERKVELLQELVECAITSVNRQLDAFASQIVNMLQARAKSGGRQASAYAEAAEVLRMNRYPFCYVVSEKLAFSLQSAAQQATNPAVRLPPIPSTLDSEVEVDKNIRLAKAGHAIEAEQTARFAALVMRLGAMLGNPNFDATHNPFRPSVFLAAVHDAWCEFHPDRKLHDLLYPLLGPDLCLDMGSVVQALNTALIRRGILPAASDQLQTGAKLASVADSASQTDPLVTSLRRLFPADEAKNAVEKPLPGSFPVLIDDTAGPNPIVARQALLSKLQALLKSDTSAATQNPEPLLVRLKQSMARQTLSQGDAVTLDLMTSIFQTVFLEPNLPGAIKNLIGQLQAPLLNAALSDRTVFFEPRHPARRVVELLVALGVEWNPASGEDDTTYQLILRNVKRIQSAHQGSMLKDVLTEMEAVFTQRDAEEAQMLAAPISQAQQQSKVLQATRVAKHEVALRIGTGEVVAFVETFLEDRWVQVLTLAYTRKDEDPLAAADALKTMDDLCWSVKPKITPDERKELIAKLPYIINNLNKWLDTVEWNEAERLTFFNELARCHASIARAPLELSPERQLQLAVKVAKRAAERRQERLAQQGPEPVPDAFDRQVEKLARGTRIEFQQKNGVTVRVRLAWISPSRNLYLFATRENTEAFSLSDEELTKAMRNNRARVVLEAGLVERALVNALHAANSDNAGMPNVA